MKNNYSKSIALKCKTWTCGDTLFHPNEDETMLKCSRCNTEYNGGYDELVQLNEQEINDEIEKTKNEVFKDLKTDFSKMLEEAFRGNKRIKLK